MGMNTKTPTPTTAAELLAEWKELQETEPSYGGLPHEYAFDAYDRDQQEIEGIAARLDQMCEDIYIGNDGFPYFGNFIYEGDGGKTGTHDAQWIAPEYQVSDLIALLQWLLIKEENGK